MLRFQQYVAVDVVNADLLLCLGEGLIQRFLHSLVKVGDDDVRETNTMLGRELEDALGKKPETIDPFIVDQAKCDIENRAEASLARGLEKGELEAVGIVGVVEAKYLRKASPHLDAIRNCPYETYKPPLGRLLV